jgi:hypothetical protein
VCERNFSNLEKIPSVFVVGHGVGHRRRWRSIAGHRRVSIGRVLRSIPTGVNRSFIMAVVGDREIIFGGRHSSRHQRILTPSQSVKQLTRWGR